MLVRPDYRKYEIDEKINWDDWLVEYEANLRKLGYKKYIQHYKHEDFCYWKTFKNGENKIYQIGVLFYDFRKYSNIDPRQNRISVMYECMLLCNDRIDMTVSKNIDLPLFELMAESFYKSMKKYKW